MYPFRELTSIWVWTSFKESLEHIFLNIFLCFLSERGKKGEKEEINAKKCFNQCCGAHSTPKLVEIHNRKVLEKVKK